MARSGAAFTVCKMFTWIKLRVSPHPRLVPLLALDWDSDLLVDTSSKDRERVWAGPALC